MTVNIDALINSLGKTYQDIFDAGLIPYKTKPTGFSGDPDLSIDMAREGLYLSFNRSDRVFTEMTLTLLDEKKPKYRFPNELPPPLVPEMTRSWVHEQLGTPKVSYPPQIIMKRQFGWKDLFTMVGFRIPTSMRITYDLDDRVKTVTFLPTSEVRW
jgi:hypothetical protein